MTAPCSHASALQRFGAVRKAGARGLDGEGALCCQREKEALLFHPSTITTGSLSTTGSNNNHNDSNSSTNTFNNNSDNSITKHYSDNSDNNHNDSNNSPNKASQRQ